ncbi:MAG TPA: DUF1869 domain-containing protein [Scandinavium sp.]|jgi:hypothetical protein|uniref:DUF1869 domain-containing protein n=1 Tax=Scandinavium sp. TaxID=2830653 RepID=UPI002E310B63|nr:DUF1869 domain-containing protein [Scandinavium sp.]HEX4501499.1 DUF1869 domain-containing protein [Scandinavium sp.]
MDNNDENKGYTLGVQHRASKALAEKVYLKPMALYVPTMASQEVTALVESFDKAQDGMYVLTVTNNNNGVSVDKDFNTLADLIDADNAADAVKDLINIVRGYDEDVEHNVCGW